MCERDLLVCEHVGALRSKWLIRGFSSLVSSWSFCCLGHNPKGLRSVSCVFVFYFIRYVCFEGNMSEATSDCLVESLPVYHMGLSTYVRA